MKKIVALSLLAFKTGLAWAGPVRTFPHAMDPRAHPDDARRLVKPPDSRTFGGRMQFMALRRMDAKTYKADLDRYVAQDRLGDIVWAHYGMLYNANVREQVEELKRRNLYLFDLWGFVPGSGPGEWSQFRRPDGVTEMFEEVLGERWLGMDNGEQDGRYVGGFSSQMVPYGGGRFHQYLNFQRHFERLDRLLGNKMATLVSLNFGHYFLREGCYTMIGAETAQALPNAQVYYSFIRGAGKQYGVPWFGNVSVFNRWGWKTYLQNAPVTSGRRTGSPVDGTSLALMKKLMYAQIFYNSVAVGFENEFYWRGRYTPDGKTALSPIGRIQRGAVDWCARNGTPGVMHVPVAVMVDFLSGWSFPRSLYSDRHHTVGVYKVWGTQPYDAGDYFTDGVLDMLYPGYQDASYFRDERGFNADTPYGDIADCLLSDAPLWLLRQYPVLVLAGRLAPTDELRDTLRAYVAQGGHLVLTCGNGDALRLGDVAGGRITCIPSAWGVAETPVCRVAEGTREECPLPKPFPLLPEARRILDGVFREQMIFGTSPEPSANGLSLVTCRRGKGDYTVCVLNNTWTARPFALTAHAGRILSVEELPIPADERGAVGFAPNALSNVVVGADTDGTIAGGGVRTFRVRLDEGAAVSEIPYQAPPPNPTNRTLVLRDLAGPVKEAVMARPTFFRHYDGVMLEGRYLMARDRADLVAQTDWLRKQGLRVSVDFSDVFNLFPGYRLVENDTNETARAAAAFASALDKMAALGARDMVVALHRAPENNMKWSEFKRNMPHVLKRLCRDAAARGITVYLRESPLRLTGSLPVLRLWIERIGEPNLRPAPALAAEMLVHGGDAAKIAQAIVDFDAPFWFVAGAARDLHGQLVSLHEPLAAQTFAKDVRPLVEALGRKGAGLVFDALYPDADAEYRDARLFERGLQIPNPTQR